MGKDKDCVTFRVICHLGMQTQSTKVEEVEVLRNQQDCFEMERRVSAQVEASLNDGKDSLGQLAKPRSWMVCNANGCYRPG